MRVPGVFKGHRPPEVLPLDLLHPCFPTTSYEESKLRAEKLCTEFAKTEELSVVSLRVPGVWTPATYGKIVGARRAGPWFEWNPFWRLTRPGESWVGNRGSPGRRTSREVAVGPRGSVAIPTDGP